MPDTNLRYLKMLGLIPVRPRKIEVGKLHEKLLALGYTINKRSIERDLHKLSQQYALISDGAKPAGWSRVRGQADSSLLQMDAPTALIYELLSRYLKPVLPRGMRNQLEPDFERARRTLDELETKSFSKWVKRIAVLPSGQQLLPPEIPAEVSEVVYDALLHGMRFEAGYLSMSERKPKRHMFNPQGLVYREGVLYLVAALYDYQDPLQFALHRMSKPVMLEAQATPLKGFDLQRYINEDNQFAMPTGKRIKLELRVDEWLSRYLSESRLARDQAIAPAREEGLFRVTAAVADTEQLCWWLRSFGPSLEVVKPAALRRRMAKEAAEAAAKYR